MTMPKWRLVHGFDEQLGLPDKAIAQRLSRPFDGWVRSLRHTLGLSEHRLAKRLAISQQAVSKLECSEVEGRITLGRLSKIAECMDCELVYALVPKGGRSYGELLDDRTRNWLTFDHPEWRRRWNDRWEPLGAEDFRHVKYGRRNKLDSRYDQPVDNLSGTHRLLPQDAPGRGELHDG